jgi:cytochrome c553
MNMYSKTKPLLLALFLMCQAGISIAEPAQSGSCPSSHGHEHMLHDPGAHPAIQKKTDEQCSNCHGTNGISVSDNIPNLAGQESLYMCGWLVGCRNQGNKCEGHEDIATKFNDHEILEFAEYYQHLPADKR